MSKILILVLFILVGCVKYNDVNFNKITYFSYMVDKSNTGTITLESPIMLWEIQTLKKNKEELFYYKAYFLQEGSFYTPKKIETYSSKLKKPIEIYLFNNKGKNNKVIYHKNNIDKICDKVYTKKHNYYIQKIICNDGTRKIITYKKRVPYRYDENGAVFENQADPVSEISYNRQGIITKKVLHLKNGIKTFENNITSFKAYEIK